MRKLLLISTVILATPLAALAQDCPAGLSTGAVLGKSLEEVEASLKTLGYEIKKGEAEDDKIEVYFVQDKAMGEVYVSPATGMITKMSYETE